MPVKHWGSGGPFAALNAQELGALIAITGATPKTPAKDRYGDKCLGVRRRQLQRLVRQRIREDAIEQRRLAALEKARERDLQQAARSKVRRPLAWACADPNCGHIGPGCPGWRDKQMREEQEIAAVHAAWSEVGDVDDLDFGDESWA